MNKKAIIFVFTILLIVSAFLMFQFFKFKEKAVKDEEIKNLTFISTPSSLLDGKPLAFNESDKDPQKDGNIGMVKLDVETEPNLRVSWDGGLIFRAAKLYWLGTSPLQIDNILIWEAQVLNDFIPIEELSKDLMVMPPLVIGEQNKLLFIKEDRMKDFLLKGFNQRYLIEIIFYNPAKAKFMTGEYVFKYK